ncbi:hypothetical protein F443_12927, partial [Phytophthora nicotianae P1569]
QLPHGRYNVVRNNYFQDPPASRTFIQATAQHEFMTKLIQTIRTPFPHSANASAS